MNVLFAYEQTGTTTPSSMRSTSRVAVQRGGLPTVTYRSFSATFGARTSGDVRRVRTSETLRHW
jgi:hypothetical protein